MPLLGALFALYWLAGMVIKTKEKLVFVSHQIGLLATWPMLCIISFYSFQQEITERIKPEHNHGYATVDGLFMFLIGATILIVYFKSVLSKTHYKPISITFFVKIIICLNSFFNLHNNEVEKF